MSAKRDDPPVPKASASHARWNEDTEAVLFPIPISMMDGMCASGDIPITPEGLTNLAREFTRIANSMSHMVDQPGKKVKKGTKKGGRYYPH